MLQRITYLSMTLLEILVRVDIVDPLNEKLGSIEESHYGINFDNFFNGQRNPP